MRPERDVCSSTSDICKPLSPQEARLGQVGAGHRSPPAPPLLGPRSTGIGGSVAPLRSRLYRRDGTGVGTAAEITTEKRRTSSYQLAGTLPCFLHLPIRSLPQRFQELVTMLEVVFVVMPFHRLLLHQRSGRFNEPLDQRGAPGPHRRPLHAAILPGSAARPAPKCGFPDGRASLRPLAALKPAPPGCRCGDGGGTGLGRCRGTPGTSGMKGGWEVGGWRRVRQRGRGVKETVGWDEKWGPA